MHGTLLLFAVTLNANRHVTGVLRGFDQFMNIVLDNAVDEKLKTDIGMVVRSCIYGFVVKLHFTARAYCFLSFHQQGSPCCTHGSA